MALDADDLNPTDRAILDELAEGRCTPAFVAEKHDYTAGNIRNRMTNLSQHGHVRGLGGGVYELVDDPRASGGEVDSTRERDHDARRGGVDTAKLRAALDRALEELPDSVPGRTAVEDARRLLEADDAE